MEITALEADGVTVQEQNCTDCVELRTPPLAEKVEALRLQARLEQEKLITLQLAGVLYLIINKLRG